MYSSSSQSFTFSFDNVKEEKSKAMLRYTRLQHLRSLLRVVELIVAIILCLWFSFRLPKISTKYLHDMYLLMLSPRVVFFIGNAIVVTLFVKSGQFYKDGKGNGTASESSNTTDYYSSASSCAGSCTGSNISSRSTDFYDEFVKNSANNEHVLHTNKNHYGYGYGYQNSNVGTKTVVIGPVFEDKMMVHHQNDQKLRKQLTVVKDVKESEKKVLKRSESESETVKKVVAKRELRRVDTGVSRKIVADEKVMPESGEMLPEMSNEEFTRKIEEFIARQIKFHRQESMAIVVPAQ